MISAIYDKDLRNSLQYGLILIPAYIKLNSY
jgi:hypothetical protein